ncbi:mast cell protease 1A [Amia ocellicauda]|uniref:mast cell protease 1A n=1 Tax=Amia ocellicauda TaxID=2972642 RepID=UPI00346428FE|nr:MCT1A protease [Amia calva]
MCSAAILCCCIALFALHGGASQVGIIGGQEASPHSRPYIASLQLNGQNFCGGVLVREDFVLTAAHCQGQQQVVLGAHSLGTKEDTQQVFRIKYSFPHPKYTDQSVDHDIMLLKLDRKATLNSSVKIIRMKLRGRVRQGTVCSTTGWGDIFDNFTASDVLREVNTTVISQRACKSRWAQAITITNTMICATDHGQFEGFCSGDSGGPLVCSGETVGVVSFSSRKCGDPKYPDVYTRIAGYRTWIQKVLKEN